MRPNHQRILGGMVASAGLLWLALCFWIPPFMFLYGRLPLPEPIFRALLRIEFVAAIFLASTGALIFRGARHELSTKSVVATYLAAIVASSLVVALFWPRQ